MHINEFAERILLGQTLSEKLINPVSLEDDVPNNQKLITLPETPNRPPELSLEKWNQKERIKFPSEHHFEDIKQRGLVLHFFANHELLALELMAWALLKFPDTPIDFKRGLVRTIKEEQEHMQLYVARMQEYGVKFGDIPLNDFFWTCLSSVDTPKDFVAAMGLTLEQANLDYAIYYTDIFRKLGDQKTVTILNQVLQDEVRHVQHGLKWFRQWKDPNQSDWEAHLDALNFPLSPARAKGLIYNRNVRKVVGFSENYIKELELYSKSKGRLPDIYFFNPICESQIALGKPGYTPPKQVIYLMEDLSALPLFFCKHDDIVLIKDKPTSPFLNKLKNSGFQLPEFAKLSGLTPHLKIDSTDLIKRKINSFQPWGWSPDCNTLFQPLFPNLPHSTFQKIIAWQSEFKEIYSKAWGIKLLEHFLDISPPDPHWKCDSQIVGKICTSIEDIKKRYQEFQEQGFQHLIIKAPFGSSGQHMIHLYSVIDLDENLKRMENLLKKQEKLIIEPWLDKAFDFSLQLFIQPDGNCSIKGITRFFTDQRGQYKGSVIGHFDVGLDKEILKFLHYKKRHHPKISSLLFNDLADHVSSQLYQVGYHGPVSIDMFVYSDCIKGKSSFRLKPIVEINPRYSMGFLALAFSKHIYPRHVGIWTILSLQEIGNCGFSTISDFVNHLETEFPIVKSVSSKIQEGVISTTDPHLAKFFISLLMVGDSIKHCQSYLKKLLPPSHSIFSI